MRKFTAQSNAALSQFFSVAVMIAFSRCSAAAAGPVHLIDFSAIPDGDFREYFELGVTFFAIDGVLTSTKFGNTPNGTRGISGYDGDNANRAMAALFNPPVAKVSVDLGDFNADADLLLLEAYDLNGVMIARQTQAISRGASNMFTLAVQGLSYSQNPFWIGRTVS